MASATGLWDAESIIFNRGRSVASWTFTGRVFHPVQRPVQRHPPSVLLLRMAYRLSSPLVVVLLDDLSLMRTLSSTHALSVGPHSCIVLILE